jgi:hypothetical protein
VECSEEGVCPLTSNTASKQCSPCIPSHVNLPTNSLLIHVLQQPGCLTWTMEYLFSGAVVVAYQCRLMQACSLIHSNVIGPRLTREAGWEMGAHNTNSIMGVTVPVALLLLLLTVWDPR